MKPLDPRLLRAAAPARRYVILTAALGVLTAVLVIAQCLLIAHALAPVIGGTATLADVAHLIGWLAVVLGLRVTVSWCQERFGQRAGVDVVADLRASVIDRAVKLGPRWLDSGHRTDVVTLVTRGLDDLQPYLTRYLPQLLLAVTVTPGALLVVLGHDWLAAVIIVGTLPLIPLFMWLVGLVTQEATTRRQRTMNRLGSQVLDLIAGIPTLRALRREHGPTQRVRELSDAYRRSTMGTLRIAFLSGMVLELLTTLSVAVVAVAVGLRLVHGGLDLTTGLAVIMLAPEVYLPVRQIGTQFHASADGIAAASDAFTILETAPLDAAAARRLASAASAAGAVAPIVAASATAITAPGATAITAPGATAIVAPGATSIVAPGTASADREADSSLSSLPTSSGMPCPNLRQATITFEDVSVAVPGTQRHAPSHLSAQIDPGTITVLAGDNGSGKSTAVQVLLGMISPTSGRVTVSSNSVNARALHDQHDTSINLSDINLEQWQSQMAWLPQRPWIQPGTIADNVGFDLATMTSERANSAAELTGLAEVLSLREGWQTVVGLGGVGLSLGQRQRVALTRILLSDAPVVIVDEPTAHLDDDLANIVIATLQQLREQGRAIIAITHRGDITPLADTIVEVRDD